VNLNAPYGRTPTASPPSLFDLQLRQSEPSAPVVARPGPRFFENAFPVTLPLSRRPSIELLIRDDRARRLPRFSAIEDAIRGSRWLLDLEESWDDEGSPPITQATWNMAVSFLRRQANVYWKHHSAEIPVPHITPGSDGSIDIHWKTSRFELLVNIGGDPEFPTDFYGDDYGRTKIKGSLDPVSEAVYLPVI
jgi:hypothetical protein